MGENMETLFSGSFCKNIVIASMLASLACAAGIAGAAPPLRSDAFAAQTLMRFYPVRLPWTPAGVTEDAAVWQAKVVGIVKSMPPMLRQSLLASDNADDFAANLDFFSQAQSAKLDGKVRAAVADAGSGPMHLKSLADSDSLVFTALPPCRIMDTRSATGASGVQGPIAGGSLYQIPGFLAPANTYQQYGGANSNCGLSTPPGSNIKAVALVITILSPNFDAFLGVSDNSNLSAVLSNVALNYTHGQGLSTVYTVPQGLSNTVYFALPAGLSAQLIFDVVGYYKLESMACKRLGSGRFAIASMAATGVGATVSCPAGYVVISAGAAQATSDVGGTTRVSGVNVLGVGTQLNAGETSDPFNGVSGGCRYDNTTLSTAYGDCTIICCRIAP
jgi:hypothetical protein